MSLRAKTILMNVGIGCALAFEAYRGAPRLSLVISAFVLFPLVNILLAKQRRAPSKLR
jgi:hypothetical protein